MRYIVYFIFMFLLISPCMLLLNSTSARGELLTPEGLELIDKPNDNGQALMLVWKKISTSEEKFSYEVTIAEDQNGPYFFAGKVMFPFKSKYDFSQLFGYAKENKEYNAYEIKGFTRPDDKDPTKTKDVLLTPDKTYFVKIKMFEEISVGKFNEKNLDVVLTTTTKGNWFATNKTNSFLILIFLTVVIMLYIYMAQRNPQGLFIRKIAGLDAMDDAIGRATEMGKMALFVHGLRTVSDVPTIAAM
ncbi:MAG: hypothetical protein HQK51_21295, partial [Oligoflexia bacterium]|nr:hypothetical protein [Oligoflexia bacterium]